MSFQINDKVVCVDDSEAESWLDGWYVTPNGYVVKGTVYVVENISFEDRTDEPWFKVAIVGLPVIDTRDGEVMGWRADRFRKLTEIQEENRLKNSNQKPDHAHA